MILYFFKNFAFLLILNVLIKPVWVFMIDIPIQNTVGHDVYGMYFTAFNFSFIFSILSDLGLNHYNNINLADKSLEKNLSVTQILPFKILISVGYIVVTSLVSIFVFKSSAVRYFVLLTALFHSLNSLVLFVRTYLSSQRLFKYDSVFSIFDKFISTLVLGILIYFIHGIDLTIELFLFVQIVSLLISISTLFHVLGEEALFKIKVYKIRFLWLRDAMPYTVLILLMGFYTRIDSTLIQLILENKDAGIYAASYRLIDFLSQFGYLSSVILLPLFSSLKKEKEALSPLLVYTSNFMMIAALILSIVLMINSTMICKLLYRHSAYEINDVFRLHLIAYPFVVLNFILGSYITAFKSIRFLILISIVGVCIQFSGNILLLNYIGLAGAPFVMIITQFWIFISQLLWIIRKHDLKPLFEWDSLLILLFGVTALAGSFLSIALLIYCAALFIGAAGVWVFRRRDYISGPLLGLFIAKLRRGE
ncbi:MAG: oligosaccharide flippase family protein [Thermaurantimonas sp.]